MRLKHLRTLASIAPLILSGLAGCATVPDQRVVPEGFAPPGTPVEVRLLWNGAGPTKYYDQTKGSWVSESLAGGIVGVLLLPVALTRDVAVSAANAARERQARWIADSITGIPDSASVESRLAEALRAELGWVTPQLANCESPGGLANCDVTLDMSPQLPGATPDLLVLTVSPVFSLRTDASALLFEYRLSICRADGVFEGKACADDRPLEATVLIHSDSLPGSIKDDATRARLVAIIGDLYSIEDLEGEERTRQAQARDKALARAHSNKLYPEEATMLAIDAWVSDGGKRLKEAFATGTRSLVQAVKAMRDNPGPPPRNSMSVTRIVFPAHYDDEIPVRDLDEIRVEPDGRRLLRSRVEPMRGGGAGNDPAANVWFSVPAVEDGTEAPEKALIEFMYR